MYKDWDLLLSQAEKFNIPLDKTQIEQFIEYWRILDDYNKKVNLVSNTEKEIVIKKHFVDSLSIGLLKDKIGWNNKYNLIDIGIGGGFPGIPIIIANPNWKLCAVDSVGKKLKFIEILAENLGLLDRVEILTTRAEDLGVKQDKREKFDLVVSRAVSQLAVLSEYCLPFVRKDGYFVAYKAKNILEEANAAQKALTVLGGKIEEILPYEIPDDEKIERNLVLIKKENLTPQKYPRKAGMPGKNPIGVSLTTK